MDVTLRDAVPADTQECGRILYEAFATLADRHGFPHDFPSIEAATKSMRALISNAGFYGIVAEVDGRVAGSSFLDERSTIHAIGPVSVDPAAQDHHVGRALMVAMLERARETGTPGVRLVQISYHNRSLSLYAKLGMDVRETFAAMHGEPIHVSFPGYAVRPATGGRRGGLQRPVPARPRAHPGGRGGRVDRRRQGEGRRAPRADHRPTRRASTTSATRSPRPTTICRRSSAPRTTSGPRASSSPSTTRELFRWCLAHGLRVFFVVNMMTIGLYQEPRGAYLPSVGY